MLVWLIQNWINLLLIAVLVLVVALLIRGLVRDRQSGCAGCGGSCSSCGGCSCGRQANGSI